MSTKSTVLSTLIAVLGCALTISTLQAQDQNSAERFFGYMDRNKDGRLDGEETRRMPSSFREAFERADYNLSRGISREDFIREMPRVMEESRRRREEEYRRRREEGDRSRDDDRRRDDNRSRDDGRRRDDDRGNSSFVYTQPKREAVTMKIPRNFEDGDTDKDGQIGLYEWRQWRPDQKYHFRVYDINGDGFLTPKELSIPPTREEINNYLASIGAPLDTSTSSSSGRYDRFRSRDRGSRDEGSRDESPSGAPQVTVTPPGPPQPPADQDRVTKIAEIFFNGMDADKSGTITSEEWARSSKLKPKFEAAGHDLSQPMDKQQFLAAYREIESNG